jgi:tricorn protease
MIVAASLWSRNMKKTLFAFLALILCAQVLPAQTDSPLLLQKPAVSATQIVFVYAGDLWIVPREGGEARRLTSGVGTETDPFFSPDGTQIAFTGEYDGNVDIYLIPAAGGVPRRMTYHPGTDRAAGWTPDGKSVLFTSGRMSESPRVAQLFTLAVDGKFPNPLPLPMAFEGAFSPDGARLVYSPVSRAFQAWKRYRGGLASKLWIARLSDSGIEMIPREKSNDFNPMWIDKAIYFLSDRNGPITLFSYDPAAKKVNQLIQNAGLDIKSASAARDVIAYEQFGSIHLYDLKSGKTKAVQVSLNGDLPSVRPRYEKIGDRLANAAISPTGARAVFEGRGEILSVPAEKGNFRNLTNSPGVAERDPSWSPDGKWIACFSDSSGEYALHLRPQSGQGEVKKIGLGDPPSFFYSPTWSPDSKKIAYTDKRLNLWYVDIEKGSPVKADSSRSGFNGSISWSPDSRWLVYTKAVASLYDAVHVYSVEDAKVTQITDGMSEANSPVFDRNGKYLYFTASTDIGPAVSGFDMSSYPHRSGLTRSIYLVVLKKDDPSPLAPESDEEKVAADKKEEAKGDKPADGDKKADAPPAGGSGKPGDKKEPPKVTIDFTDIGQRILALPAPARNYLGLSAGKEGILFIAEAPQSQAGGGPMGAVIHKFELEKRKLEKFLDNAAGFEISANGEKILYRQGQSWFITGTGQVPKPGDGKLRTDELEVYVDPRAEWNQMYRETWRIERDFFYDPNYHGLDIKATAAKYEPYLKGLAHRADLNYLFQEMLGELSVGHLYVNGGDTPNPKRVPGGLLGADYRIENGRYRFARVFSGENWNPQLRAPLTQPGVNVKEGEYLLAVAGRDLTPGDNFYQAFEATADKQVVLRVGPNPDGSGARDVTVVPVASETGIRTLAWIEGNRRKVDQLSGGRLAYVWLPDTAGGGYTNFNRYYFAQLNKEGLVVDERFNGGGHAADYIIDYLKKPLNSYWAVRDGEDWRQPFGTLQGPKAMIINEYAGSGGDYMPWLFRRSGIGPLIGKRTWGGLVGIGGYPTLIDGGSVTAPHFAFYSPEGQWEIENNGVAPDIEVELDPKACREGKDPQLEKAVEVLLNSLKEHPIKKTARPPYPNYHKAPPQPKAGK